MKSRQKFLSFGKDCTMEKTVPLKDIAPYIGVLKQYFGLNHPTLELEAMLLDRDPDRTFEIIEHVTSDRIGNLLSSYFPQLEENAKNRYQDILWLVCNLYYGTSYDDYEYYYQNEVAYEANLWNTIRRDILQLYIFEQKHKGDEDVSIQIGKGKGSKVTLMNIGHWFQWVLDNHLYPNTIPEIGSVEEAKGQLTRTAGRHVGSYAVNAIVNGVASMFKDGGVITGTAPKELLAFVFDILVEMSLVDPSKGKVTTDWIKGQISNLSKSEKDARFPSSEWERCTRDELTTNPEYRQRLDWIYNPPKK